MHSREPEPNVQKNAQQRTGLKCAKKCTAENRSQMCKKVHSREPVSNVQKSAQQRTETQCATIDYLNKVRLH